MRRVLLPALVGLGLLVGGFPGAAFATPSPTPPGEAAPAGQKVCTITDDRLVELSGMVATADGFVVINDSSDLASRKKIFFLDRRCAVTVARSYSGGGPRDPEDAGLAPDGTTLYIADIGDNDKSRSTVVLWTMPVSNSQPPVLHRLTYPDGKHDAEALLFNGDGSPIIVTREAGKAGLYSPTAPLRPGTTEGVPMRKLGEVKWPKTPTTNSFLGPLAQVVITGGATAPDGSRVLLRTYADAFEWDVSNGDVVAALTHGKPRFTPLPGEPRGESITYSPDGTSFLTVSETADQPAGTRPEIRRYTPSEQVAVDPRAQSTPRGDNRSWFAKLSLQDITYLIAAVGLIGAVLVGAGLFGIVRARRAEPPGDDLDPSGRSGRPDGGDSAGVPGLNGSPGRYPDDLSPPPGAGPVPYPPARTASGSASVHGGGSPAAGVYGRPPARDGIYGGGRSGTVYGGGPPGGSQPEDR